MLANCHQQPLPERLNPSETKRDNIADRNCYRKLGHLERYNMTSASDHIIQDYDLFTAPIKVPPSRNDHVSQQIRNKFGDYDSVARNIVHFPEDSISCLYDNNLKRKKNCNNNNNVVNYNVQNTNSHNIALSQNNNQQTVKNGYDMVPVHYQSSVDNSAFVSKNNFSYKTSCDPNSNPKLCNVQKREIGKEPTNITNEYPKLHSKPVKPLTKLPAVANADTNAKNSQIPKPETKNIKAIWNEMIDNRPPIKSIPNIPLKESVKPKDSNSSSSGQLDLKKPQSSIFDTPTPKSKKTNSSALKKVPELDCMISLNEFIEFRPPISAIPSTPSVKEQTKSTKVSDLSSINNKLHEMIETRPPISAIPLTPVKESKKLEMSTSNSSTSHAGSTPSVQKKNCRRLSSTRLSADLREDLRISDDSDDNDEVAGLKKHDKTKSSDSAMQNTNSTKMTSSELPVSSKSTLPLPVAKTPTSCSDSNTDSDSSSDDSDEDCQVPTSVEQLPPQQPPQSSIKNEMESKPRWNLGSYLDKNLFPQNETALATVTNPATSAQKTENNKKDAPNSKKDGSKHSKSSSKMKSNKVILSSSSSSSSSSAESDKETKKEPSSSSVPKSKKDSSRNKKTASVKKIIEDSSDSDQDKHKSQHHSKHTPNKVEKLEKKSRGRPRKRRSRFSSTSSSATSQSSADTDATFNSMRRLNSLSSERKYNRPVVTVRPLSPQQSSISSNSDDENRSKFNKKVTTNKTVVNNPYFQKPTDVGNHPPTTNSNSNRKVYQKSNDVDSSKRQKTVKDSAAAPKPQLQMQPPNSNRQDGPVYESRGGKSKQATTKEQSRHSPVPVQNKITKKSQSKGDGIDNCKKIDYNDYDDVRDQKKKFTLRKLFTPKKDSEGGKNGKGGKVGKVEIIVIDKKDSLNSINNNQDSLVKNEPSVVNDGSGVSSMVCNIDLRQCISLPLSVMMKVSAEVIPCLPAMKDVVFDDVAGPKHPHLNNMKRKRRGSESSSASLSSPVDLPNSDLMTDMKPPNKKVNRINDVANVQFTPNERNLYPNSHDRFMGYHQAGNLDPLRPIPNSYVAGPAHSYLNMNYHCETPYQPAAAFPPFLMQPPVGMRSHYSYIDDVPNDLDHNDYFSEATRLKHEATLIKDDTAQVMKFLESVLGFLIAGSALERDVTNDNTAAFTLYKETLDLIKNISKRFKWYKKMSPIQSKLAILSFRTQALLHLKLYQMQNFNCKEIQKTCNTFFKCNRFNPVPMDLNGNGVQISSPLSPNPSPCSSNSQSSGYASCNNDLKTGQCVMHSNSPMMPISRHIYNAFQKQNAIFYYLYSCHDLWNEADQMTYKFDHRDFFHNLDQAYRPLTLHSSLYELVHYVKAAIRVLKEVRS